MANSSEPKKTKYTGKELESILGKLEGQGLIDLDEDNFTLLSEAILRRKRQEIIELKGEFYSISNEKFKTRVDCLDYLKNLFPDILHPLEP